MTRTPDISTYHREGIAVNVKDRHYWPGDPVAGPAIEELGESLAESIYEQVRMQFWDDAEELARDHGYDHVYSTGRQGGWLYVTDRGRGVDIDYDRWADGAYGPCDEWEQFERDEWQRFATFANALMQLLDAAAADFRYLLGEELRELNARREANEIRSVN